MEQVICMDANLTDDAVRLFTDKLNRRDVQYYLYNYMTFEGVPAAIKVSHSKNETISAFLNRVTELLVEGKNICCPVNSLKLANLMEEKYEAYSPLVISSLKNPYHTQILVQSSASNIYEFNSGWKQL